MKGPLEPVLRRVTSPAVVRHGTAVRLLRGLAAARVLPTPSRVTLAKRLRTGMIRAGWSPEESRAALAAVARTVDADTRADLLVQEVTGELKAGRTPAHLAEAVGAELAAADQAYARGDRAAAARRLHRALRTQFHRTVQFDQLTSPLVDDPAAFLAPLRDSAVGRVLLAPRGRSVPAAPPPADRPLRLLVMTNGNDHFLREIRERYADHPGVEFRYLHLADDPVAAPLTRRVDAMVAEPVLGGSEYGEQVERWLRPHLDWADVLFVDWAVATAVMVTLVDPGDTRVVLRLHSFEAFSFWPHLIDFSRIDDVVFVSDHLRDLAAAVSPDLVGEYAPRLHVISNAMDLRPYAMPKEPAARFTLGLVGISAVAKDPRWAIEVLRLLRAEDPRYRLLLVGAGLNTGAGEAIRAYGEALEVDLAELEPAGAVVRIGQVTDVPKALTEIGVILSTSVRESFHCAVVEGAASGAVPVVRDWPFFAAREHGAHSLFPADWVVRTPAEAAARIRAETADEEAWRAGGAAAAAHALATWDWTVTRHHFDALLGVADPTAD
ncbi:glycosyltransferase family 1 protein [Micromonospora globispora]|uniref:Glycosyltransferase family 1 protein n=1 Tax=Micromonospora globispora TaxID=1450148 RepID=A0A317JXS0_9ACTN|nr:glycosyltransferase [Micromonospora globispora]PWU44322.1 glycosyltransferase family 1 protein [Micromonospora globispora]RQX02712.1 glycosyltransferase family 1 protein [Micromonospora globispora]